MTQRYDDSIEKGTGDDTGITCTLANYFEEIDQMV